jgi:pimeloyl-ACP methyl ester carboxylesterase
MPFVTVKGRRLHYRQNGSGPVLLLLHGLGSNASSWEEQLQGLSDYFTVIAWDAPGYGQSDDPVGEIHTFEEMALVLKGFVEQLGIEPFYLLGHSMGSTLALAFYHRYPQAVRALILADATRGGAAKDGPDNERKLQSRLHAIETQSVEEIARQRAPNLVAAQASAAVKARAEEIYAQIRPAGYRSVSYCLYHADQSHVLAEIQVPTLVICGEEDQITPVSESKIIHQGIDRAEWVLLPESGHLCYQEKPKEFNQAVIRFLHACGEER